MWELGMKKQKRMILAFCIQVVIFGGCVYEIHAQHDLEFQGDAYKKEREQNLEQRLKQNKKQARKKARQDRRADARESGHDLKQDHVIHVSFDRLHRSSWFKRALDSCMAARGDLRENAYNNVLPHDRQLLAEVTIGRLAYAQFCFLQAVDSHRLSFEDVRYLARIVEALAQEVEDLGGYFDDGRDACLNDLLDDFVIMLDDFM